MLSLLTRSSQTSIKSYIPRDLSSFCSIANEIQWTHVDEADRASVQEKKIRVIYLAPEGSAAVATPLKNGVNGLTNGAVSPSFPVPPHTAKSSRLQTPDTAPPAYTSQRSPSPEEPAYTPDTRRSTLGGASIKQEDESDARSAASVPAMPNSAPPPVPMSYAEIKVKLEEAQATIASYAQEGGMRMRKVAKGETSNETVNEIAHRVQNSQGVPLQVVAALCLVSFLLAYLFF